MAQRVGDDVYAGVERVGSGMAVTVLTMPQWIHRRTESLRFTEGRAFTRSTTVDFTLPAEAPTLASGLRIVPLASLNRGVLAGLDTRDEDGRPVPVLTTGQNAQATGAMLVALATARGLEDPGIHEFLRAVAGPHPPADPELHSTFAEPEWDPSLRQLIRTLSRSFVLCVLVKAEDGERRILKYSVRQEFPLGAWRHLPMALGWVSVRLAWHLRSANLAQSYHAELVLPEEVLIH